MSSQHSQPYPRSEEILMNRKNSEDEDEVENYDEESDLSESLASSGVHEIADERETKDPTSLLKEFKDESDAFCAVKALLVGLFVVTAITLAITAYTLTNNQQQDDFESKFRVFAAKLADASVCNARNTFGQLGLFGADITSHALTTSAAWPLHSIPYFDETVEKTLKKTVTTKFISFSPLVAEEARAKWENYTTTVMSSGEIPTIIHNSTGPLPENAEGPFAPIWQSTSDASDVAMVNFDLISCPSFSRGLTTLLENRIDVLTEPEDFVTMPDVPGFAPTSNDDEPYAFFIHPIYGNFGKNKEIVGTLSLLSKLQHLFADSGTYGLVAIIRDKCGLNYTYVVNDDDVRYMGDSDLHNEDFDYLANSVPFTELLYEEELPLSCGYTLDIYPSVEFQVEFMNNEPWVYAGIVLAIFFLTGLLLVVHNRAVKTKHDRLMNVAVKTTTILASLFPTNVHSRLFSDTGRQIEDAELQYHVRKHVSGMKESIMKHDDGVVNGVYATKPIADLFLHTSIMFADIPGFTAWSSEREPVHIFTLLETIFRAFDKIARRLGVFKVETIGDCYVAVAGLPHARKDHAVVMTTFAKECMATMMSLVRKMEVSLGPDTGDLSMRFGVHSGPVTAGVLRGEKSRFQLFGDSVNTAARINTTGESGKIHISQDTAELLLSAGHSNWLIPRQNLVTAKGKGVLRTYWIAQDDEDDQVVDLTESLTSGNYRQEDDEDTSERNESSASCSEHKSSVVDWGTAAVEVESNSRLVDWNVDVLYQLLQKVVAKRHVENCKSDCAPTLELDLRFSSAVIESEGKRQALEHPENIDPIVKTQLRSYVSLIASMYRNHPFHNFEHASHVMLSITKLLSRISAPRKSKESEEGPRDVTDSLLHDPLLLFAVAFSALIHDVDHAGVPNTQLLKEDENLARKYRFRSVAEKHSIRLSWERLMDSKYRELRNCLCPTQSDLKRFRNFVINTVMATDIADKDLNSKRKDRWRKCFEEWPSNPTGDDVKRKATIIIEHLIQASDVAHTMQHFEVFKKWNERLFHEVYSAFQSKRAENDPSKNWYEGEIEFFEFYIIPLALKLETCGVFGVSSTEYLSYAEENKERWKSEGRAIVEAWVRKYKDKRAETGDDLRER